MRFVFIDAEKTRGSLIPLSLYCRTLRVTCAGYFAWKASVPSAKARADVSLGDAAEALFETSLGSYGAGRLCQHLNKRGFSVGKTRMRRLMRERGLSSRIPRKYVCTTDSKHSRRIAENIVDRQFSVAKPDALWLTDISYLETTEGFLYIAAVLDAFSRRVIGYAIDSHMKTSLCEKALRMALRTRTSNQGLLCHSDRGSQYASGEYRKLLSSHGIVCSMSRKGNCWDNAMMESFFGRLKNEYMYRLPKRDMARTKQRTQQWIELWYNSQRVHTSLEGCSPMEWEHRYWQRQKPVTQESEITSLGVNQNVTGSVSF